MEQNFFIPGPLPGLNEMLDAKAWMGKQKPWGRQKRWTKYNDLKQKWEAMILMEIHKAKLKIVGGPAILQFYWTERDSRRDLDNIAAAKKWILDALVTAGILPDDRRPWVIGWTDIFPEPDKKKPGVSVIIQAAGFRLKQKS